MRSGPLEDGPQPQEVIHDLCWAGPRQSQSTVPDLPKSPLAKPPKSPGETPQKASGHGDLERNRLPWVGREERAFTFAVVNHDPFSQISIHSVPVFFFFVCLSVFCLFVCCVDFSLQDPCCLGDPGLTAREHSGSAPGE